MPRPGRCSRCGKHRMVVVNRQLGDFLCHPCYVKHYQPRWRCIRCNRTLPARFVVDPSKGDRLCAACYQADILTGTCSRCGTPDATIHHRTARGKIICTDCYHKHYQRSRRAGREEPTEHQLLALREMKRIARMRGGRLLSQHYEDSQTHVRWRCRAGHEWDAMPAAVKQGTWCIVCVGLARGTIEQMQALARDRGGECLAREYVNDSTPLPWRCAEGHEWSARPGSIKGGQWCPHCGGTARLTLDQMQALARDRGGECLSRDYVNLETPMRWRCAEGHVWTTTGASVKTAGAWCPTCAGVAKPRLATLRAHARERGGECLATEYSSGKLALPWRCAEGHEWRAPWSRIQSGAWCPECGRARMRLPRRRLSLADMHRFAARLGGRCLSSEYTNSVTKLKWQCAEGHVFEAVQSTVANGHWCPECAGRRRGSIDDLQAVARERGGECVSKRYRSASATYRWRCAHGHEWNARAANVKHGTWCPVCAHRVPLGIAAMRELAVSRGGKCLSRIYVSLQTHLRWRCAKDHEWDAIPSSIKAGTWCPTCAIEGKVARNAAARRPE